MYHTADIMKKPARKMITVRIDPDVWQIGRIAAVTAKKTMGQWLEEAIREKSDKDRSGDKKR